MDVKQKKIKKEKEDNGRVIAEFDRHRNLRERDIETERVKIKVNY